MTFSAVESLFRERLRSVVLSKAGFWENPGKSLFQRPVAARFQRADGSAFSGYRHVENVPPHGRGTDSKKGGHPAAGEKIEPGRKTAICLPLRF